MPKFVQIMSANEQVCVRLNIKPTRSFHQWFLKLFQNTEHPQDLFLLYNVMSSGRLVIPLKTSSYSQ